VIPERVKKAASREQDLETAHNGQPQPHPSVRTLGGPRRRAGAIAASALHATHTPSGAEPRWWPLRVNRATSQQRVENCYATAFLVDTKRAVIQMPLNRSARHLLTQLQHPKLHYMEHLCGSRSAVPTVGMGHRGLSAGRRMDELNDRRPNPPKAGPPIRALQPSLAPDALLVDLGLDEPCQVSQRLLPTEITGLEWNDVRQACLHDIQLGAD